MLLNGEAAGVPDATAGSALTPPVSAPFRKFTLTVTGPVSEQAGEGDGNGSMTSSCLNDQMGKSVAAKRFNSGVSGFGLLIMKASANR